jgi:hypothetical protein
MNGKETALSSDDFAKDPDKGSKDVKYDFRDFNDPKVVYEDILKAKPLIKNLQILDKYARRGFEIAFLTARSSEAPVYKALNQFLKIRGDDNQLHSILGKLSRELSVAISDPKYDDIFPKEASHAERKSIVLNDYCDLFDEVIFVDDDEKNIAQAKGLHRDNLKVIKAS